MSSNIQSSASAPVVEMNKDLGFEVGFKKISTGVSCNPYEDLFTSLLSSKFNENSQVVSRVPPQELKAFCDELLVDLVAKSDLQLFRVSGTLLIVLSVVLYFVAGVIPLIVVSVLGSWSIFFGLRSFLSKKRMEAIAQTIVKHNRALFKPRGLLVVMKYKSYHVSGVNGSHWVYYPSLVCHIGQPANAQGAAAVIDTLYASVAPAIVDETHKTTYSRYTYRTINEQDVSSLLPAGDLEMQQQYTTA